MGLGQQAAVRIDRQFSIKPDCTACNERPALALVAETHVLELAKNDVSEAIVDLRDVDIVVRDAGHRERLGRGLGDPQPGHVGTLRDDAGRVRMAFGDTHDVHRRLA